MPSLPMAFVLFHGQADSIAVVWSERNVFRAVVRQWWTQQRLTSQATGSTRGFDDGIEAYSHDSELLTVLAMGMLVIIVDMPRIMMLGPTRACEKRMVERKSGKHLSRA